MTGIILLQLGTPDAPTPRALRRYLRQFLSDRRVIDLPRWLWWPILHGMVLPRRPRKSAHAYQKIWTPAGSPLAVISAAQVTGLEAALAARLSHPVRAVVGMRYGEPSIASALDRLAAEGVDRLLAFPAYPQYASATTGSSLECLSTELNKRRVIPAVRAVPPYYNDPLYVGAIAAVARETLANSRPDRLLLSFHGLPRRYTTAGDPYADHCHATAAALERAVNDVPVIVAFQSRFGPEEWLQPYTNCTLEALGREGVDLAVMCPGFIADCLETLEEIGIRGAQQFRDAGGRNFRLVPCLNDHPAWIAAMTAIACRELAGWLPD